MLQLPSNQLITVPFCALGTPSTDFVLPPIVGSDSSLIQTQQFGIPPVQQRDPNFGGLPVLRTETNGVLQFYSNVLYFINQGGQFTFDAPQSTALGGYSQGAVLFNFPTSSYVISLIDNNTFDFVTTPSYIDGIHWEQLNSLAYPDITDIAGLVSIIGSGGLSVTGGSTFTGFANCLGGLEVTGTAIFNEISLRGGWVTYAASASQAYLGSNGTNTGGFNGFIFDDTIGRPTLNNPGAAIVSVNEVVCFRDLAIVQAFSVTDTGGNPWTLICQSFSGAFPSNCFSIIGNATYTIPAGPSTTNIDLGAAGIAAVVATLGTTGVSSEFDFNVLTSLLIRSNTGQTLLNILTNSASSTPNSLQFQLLYR